MDACAPGTVVERREVLHGQVWLSTPVTVVDDDGETLAVLLVPGAPMTYPDHPFGPHPWAGVDTWGGTTVLQLHRADDWYAVWRMFEGDRDLGWYVNFEAPIRRGHARFETLDYGLDLVIPPDGPWTWKDVDDPDELVREGRITREVADELRTRAAALAQDLDAGRRWWAGWDRWTPEARP
ncbi:DUF402 domain-containing protein [Nocardioides lianchengensis]|uniref:DUF402 domain-containing protein n=1 Tax=Nocardioides lianchengensis TaxID=1045774 RepID=A0A1G6V0D4_9ACTN|nr:DUF402 domain-containing protein [Nocardioides lianchengensis]NYG11080.1 hypothetical protein [Nocardioides lianchengensis]SDD46437.1 Protein of unknown function [Nocardioides lianchengensis]